MNVIEVGKRYHTMEFGYINVVDINEDRAKVHFEMSNTQATLSLSHLERDPGLNPAGVAQAPRPPQLSVVNGGRAQAQPAPVDEDEAELEQLLDIVTASDITIRRVRYLWTGRVPIGAVTLMPGEEGIGKTTVGARIIADLTLGRLEGEFYGTPRDALFMAPEDGLADVMTPRLKEAGADLSRVHFIKAKFGLDGSPSEVIIPRDLKRVGKAVERWDVALLWIDSLATTLPDELKSIAYKDTAKVLRAVGQWAEDARVSVVAPWHLNKAAGSDTALRIMDSRAFRTAVRSMLLVVEDPDAPEGTTRGIVALDKANAGTLHVPALRYELRAAHYYVEEVDPETGETFEAPADCSVAEWIGEMEGNGRDVARNALLPKMERDNDPRTWLHDYLEQYGETERQVVLSDAKDEMGWSDSKVKRAARAIKVASREESGRADDGRPWRRAYWRLNGSEPRQPGHTHTSEPTDPTGEAESDPNGPIYRGEAKSGQSGHA